MVIVWSQVTRKPRKRRRANSTNCPPRACDMVPGNRVIPLVLQLLAEIPGVYSPGSCGFLTSLRSAKNVNRCAVTGKADRIASYRQNGRNAVVLS